MYFLFAIIRLAETSKEMQSLFSLIHSLWSYGTLKEMQMLL